MTFILNILAPQSYQRIIGARPNDTSMVYRISVVFKGKVQGVRFREYARRWAEMLSLNGYVQNMSDGSVHAVFEGQHQAVQEIIRKLKNEHPNAEVAHIDIQVEEPEGLEGFKIIH